MELQSPYMECDLPYMVIFDTHVGQRVRCCAISHSTVLERKYRLPGQFTDIVSISNMKKH